MCVKPLEKQNRERLIEILGDIRNAFHRAEQVRIIDSALDELKKKCAEEDNNAKM